MASNVKNERAMKAETLLSDGRQLNTYFPLHCKLVFAEISNFKSYVILSEPGDQRKKRIKAYLLSNLTLAPGLSRWPHAKRKGN